MHESHRSQEQLLSDLDVLLQLVSQQRQHCETFRVLYEEEERPCPGVSVGVVRSASAGRLQDSKFLKNSWKRFIQVDTRAGFRWASIARMLRVSESTLQRRRHEFREILELDFD